MSVTIMYATMRPFGKSAVSVTIPTH